MDQILGNDARTLKKILDLSVFGKLFLKSPQKTGAIKSGTSPRTAEPQLGEWSRLLKWTAPINSHPPFIFQGRRPDTYPKKSLLLLLKSY